MSDFAAARAVIVEGLAARAFPAAAVEVGSSAGARWREAFGRLSFDDDAPPCRLDTIFDLASLTKVLATASLVMRHVTAGTLTLETRIADRLAPWTGSDRAAVTVRHLLEHSSGLPAHVRLFETLEGRAAIERAIAEVPLEATPGAAAVYSDLGFILLGFLLEDSGDASLDRQFDWMRRDWQLDSDGTSPLELTFRPPATAAPRIAPTEIDQWRGRLLRSEVHDENAAALGGVAGHAGLFGTAGAVGAFARLVLRSYAGPTALGTPALMRQFAARSAVAGSSRALAWDTMKPTSSCGTRLSPTAIGHTGFTGTSLWIDEANDVYVVFLTNRVHPTRQNDALVAMRPRLHDAVAEDLSLGS